MDLIEDLHKKWSSLGWRKGESLVVRPDGMQVEIPLTCILAMVDGEKGGAT